MIFMFVLIFLVIWLLFCHSPSVFFEADHELIELSKAAVDKIKSAGKVIWGRMVTGESFITDEGRKKISDKLAPLTVDMEKLRVLLMCAM